jgi:hypothetical protein
MSLLYLLPTDLYINIISNWLIIDTITRIDTAFCNHSERKNFLEASYQLQSFSVDCSEILPNIRGVEIKRNLLVKKATNWAICKTIKISKLIITQSWMNSSKLLLK